MTPYSARRLRRSRALAAIGHATALLIVAYLAVVVVLRPWQRHWGATDDERSFPGACWLHACAVVRS
jgi:hypothetical protein